MTSRANASRASRVRWGGWWAAIIWTLCALPCALWGGIEARAQTNPATVKAVFLYRFASFVQWPPGTAPDAPISLCVMGADGFRQTLEHVVNGQHLGARSFTVRRVDNGASEQGCQILYLGGQEDDVRRALRASNGTPTLTVTDADATPDVHGIIHFVVLDDRVRFHIDDERAAANHLGIDSRLLSLAVSVRRRAAS
jgi:hypothetical protein